MQQDDHPIISTRHVIFLTGIFIALYAVSRSSYLLMHTLVEMLSVVVACSTFMIAWNARRFMRFPDDFMFALKREEIQSISRIVISSSGRKDTLK